MSRVCCILLAILAIATIRNCDAAFRCIGTREFPDAPCPALNPDNGHYYAIGHADGAMIDWEAARDAADSLQYNGIPGHLLTITSQAEADFLARRGYLSSGIEAWMGATDAEVEGEWRWAVGPEAGELFWTGNFDGNAVKFSAWISGEPNNRDDEDYLTWRHNGWNDADGVAGDFNWQYEYLIEFSPVSEPSSAHALACGAVILTWWAMRRTPNRGRT